MEVGVMKYHIICTKNRAFWGKVIAYLGAFFVGVVAVSVVFPL